MEEFFKFVDSHQQDYVHRLGEAVGIQSVSGDPLRRDDVVKMGHWIKDWILKLGGYVEVRDVGTHTVEGQVLQLPPILLGHFGQDPTKRTVCVYGHYDVQPAKKEDGWSTDPFTLTEVDGKLFGRGATDDKGPVISWLWVVEAYQAMKKPLPVNLKFCFEGMEESGSEGLEELVNAEAKKFFGDVDFFCISDNYWLGTTKPCLTYGLRGLCYFFLEVDGGTKDLHSGVYGGTVPEAMTTLIQLMGSLVDTKGKILVPGMYDLVAPVTEEEKSVYHPIDFSPEGYKSDAGVNHLLHDSKQDTLMHRWRFPSLTLHGIEGAWSGSGAKTVIPRKVVGKFSIRLVPDMEPSVVEDLVNKHLQSQLKAMGSPLHFKLAMSGSKAWVSSFNHPNFIAGRNATKLVWGMEPDLTREGGSIPITLTFEEATGKNVILLPIGRGDDGAHSQNEKLDKVNYINGIKLLGSYLDEVAKLPK